MIVRVSNVTVRKRLILLLIIGLLVFITFIARLGYVQFVMGDWLYSQAQDTWSRNIPYEAQRGDIVDRNGIELATNASAPSVLVVPSQVQNPAKASRQLADILNMKQKKAYKKITKEASTVEIRPEGKKISNEKAEKIRDLRISGVYIAEDFIRHYPKGSFLSHVLGFAGIDNQGLTGLEAYYDNLLKGEKGHVSLFSDVHGEKMPFLSEGYQPPKDGLDLKLTVNAKIQAIIERELNQAALKYNPDGAIAIAMNPNNGEVLGMSSRPTFNPENYQNVPSEIYNHNLPVWKTFEPGSTFKIITLASALNEDLVNLDKDKFHDPGYIKVSGQKLKCWKSGGHGSETFLEVVQNSCNPGFVALGQRLGKNKLFSYIHDFGFGSKTGIDLQGEGTGILFDVDNVGPLELGTTSFGQGVSVTPIQQVMAVSAAINGGYLYEPYIAKGWMNPETQKMIKRHTPKLKRRVISKKTSKEVRRALESVVAKGTGGKAYIDGYRVGGKTGTAQKVKNGKYLKNNYILSFMAFAPADNPQLLVYVAIDNPKDTLQFGGQTVAPISKKIMRDSLQVLDVKKRKHQLKKERAWNEQPKIKVPDLVGVTKQKLKQSLYTGLKLDAEGSGDVVVSQSPDPGTKLKRGSTIRIYLGDKVDEKD